MSDTPETDAAELIYDGIVASGYVDSEVCRKLERERDEARRGIRLMAQNAEVWKERARRGAGGCRHVGKSSFARGEY